MAGTALNFDTTVIQAGSAGTLWAGLATPAASARLTLVSGTPDGTENTSAINLGMTREGATLSVTPTYEEYFADEFSAPIKSKMSGLEATLTAELLQVTDEDILQKVMSGFGTYSTAAGYKQNTLGIGVQAFTGLALIFPLEADPTKYGVFHLYQAYCSTGLDALQVSRKAMSGINTVWKGTDITTRATTDTLGNYWKQI